MARKPVETAERTRGARGGLHAVPQEPPSPVPASRPVENETLASSVRLLQRENSTLRLLVAIHDRLGALVLEGASAASITTVLSGLVNRTVILLDALLKPITDGTEASDASDAPVVDAEPLWRPDEPFVARVLQTMAGERRALRLPPLPAWGVGQACVLAPVVVGDTTAGYLAILEPETEEEAGAEEVNLLAAQHAANVYALAMMREQITASVATELKDELMEGLLLGQVTSEMAARERASQLGYDESVSYRALVIVADEVILAQVGQPQMDSGWAATRRARQLDNIAKLVRDRAPGALVTARRDEVVVFVPELPGPSTEEIGKSVLRQVSALYPDWPVTLGVGATCHSPTEISRSYAEARRAAEIALRFGRQGQVVSFQDLGLYRLLFQVSDRSELKAFVDHVLGPLIEYDRRHRTDLVRTITSYLANNNSLQATARDLFVHVNTAAYRIQRIQLITGLDLTRTDDCLLVRVALMIMEDMDVR